MSTRIGNKGGFANITWVQLAALVIVPAFLIAVAAKCVWLPT